MGRLWSESMPAYKSHRGDFRWEKHSDKGCANGVRKLRAWVGQTFTQAQQLIQRAASIERSSRMAPTGQVLMQVPHSVHKSLSKDGTDFCGAIAC